MARYHLVVTSSSESYWSPFPSHDSDKIAMLGRDRAFRDTLHQSFSTFFNSRHTEQGAKIVKANHQFFKERLYH
jgi:hypothetical protein